LESGAASESRSHAREKEEEPDGHEFDSGNNDPHNYVRPGAKKEQGREKRRNKRTRAKRGRIFCLPEKTGLLNVPKKKPEKVQRGGVQSNGVKGGEKKPTA